MEASNNKLETLQKCLAACKVAFNYSLLFSFFSNLMMLAIPMYSLQVLDRVVSSGSLETLLMLTLVVLLALSCLSLIQFIRSSILIRLGHWLEHRLAPMLFAHAVASSAFKRRLSGNQHLQDLTSVKNFLTGTGVNALLDLPWSLIFIVALFFIHPLMSAIAVIGAMILLTIAILNEINTKSILEQAGEYTIKSLHYTDIASRNAEAIEAMGMLGNVTQLWQNIATQAAQLQSQASKRSAIFSSATRFLRLMIQISVTGTGAYFVLQHEMTVGGMIAAGILVGRAMAPFENAIASWKSFVMARKARQRLLTSLEKSPTRPSSICLPTPQGALSIENTYFTPPGGKQKHSLKNINFNLAPGEVLALIGPSAAGKSTLAKLLTGVWRPSAGNVRLDNADIYAAGSENFSGHIGYLPQDIELFSGTVKENIARMDQNADDQAIITAAQRAQVHDLILHLSDGYETQIGVDGMALSAGQRQRIALARAFYGDPKLMVLDEPNASLDHAGNIALAQAIQQNCRQKITTIIISHRPAILQLVDKIIVLQDGQIMKFGSRDEVLQSMQTPQQELLCSP